MAVDVIIDPSSGQIYWNDAAGSGTQTIAISGNATNAINIVGYSNFFSPGGGGLGTQILATFNDSATSTFVPGTNAYDLGSTALRWNFYGTAGNFTGVITTTNTTASTGYSTGALLVHGGVGVSGNIYSNGTLATTYTGGSGLNIANRVTVSTSSGFENLNVNSNYSFAFNVQDTANNNRFTVDVQNNRTNFSGSSAAHEIRFYHSNQSSYTGFRANSTGTVTYTWPAGDGTANQVLYTNGSAALGWTSLSSVSAITTLNGLTASTQTFATGTSGTDFNISSVTSTHTFNIPYAGSGATGLITTQTQTIAGAKTFSGQTSITNSTASTSTTTGALIITGGVGIAGSIWSGQHIVTDTTVSTTTATGAMLVFGGLGVSGQINSASLVTSGNAVISGNLQFNGVGTFGNATSDTITYNARANSDFLPSADNSYDLGNNSLGWRNFRVSGVGTIATLQVTSITSGLWAGSAVTLAYGGTNNNISGVGHSYRVAIYDAAGTAITNISSAGTANSILLQSSQSASPNWAGQSQLVVGGASTAANIQGGALGNIHYQTAANSTGFITNAAGTGSSILTQAGNTAPVFLGQSQLVVGGASTSANIQGGALGNLHYQTGANATGFVTNAAGSGASILSQTGNAAPVFLGQSQLAVGSASIATSSVSSATTTDTTSTLYLLGSRSSTGFAGTAIYVDTNISILGSQVTAGVWAGTAISAVNGGTGQVSYTIGDILYASSTTALAKLAAGTAGSVLKSNGAGTAPSWQADATGSGGAGTVATPTASNLVAYYPGTGASVTSNSRVSIDTANSSVEISSQSSKSGLILNAVNGSISNLAEFKNSFGDVLWSVGATAGTLRGFGSSLWLDSASTLLLTSPAALSFYDTTETFATSLTGATNASANLTFILPTAAGTAGSVLATAGASGQLYWSAPGTSGGGAGTVANGTSARIAYYPGTGSSVKDATGFEYSTSGTTNTVRVFGGSAIGNTYFVVNGIGTTQIRVGIGVTNPAYELEIEGEISATNKSFVIDHPTKPGKKLRYGSLEGPENGVYVRGELKNSNVIETPDHWEGLVYPDSFTITLTPIGRFSHLYVVKIEDYKVFIADAYMNPIHCYYTVWAERKDIPKLVTEY